MSLESIAPEAEAIGALPRRATIVSINYAPELTGIGVYTTGLAEGLARAGMDVTVVTAFPYYPSWVKRPCDRRTLFRGERAGPVRLRRSYVFVPRRPTALARIVHELSFAVSAAASYLLAPRAEVTVLVTPPLPLGVPIGLIARLKGSRLLVHVQDLQPDAAVELGMLRGRTLARLLYAIERATYRLADRVSAVSDGMAARLIAKGVPRDKVRVLRNWADADLVQPRDAATAYRRAWGLEGKTVVLYAGNLGVKQGLEVLLDAASRLDRARPDLAFVIVGDGGEKPRLQARAAALALGNVRFEPLQPAERLSELLATADIAVVTQRPTVRDIVMPSKVGNMMASARPVVAAAAPGSELARVLEEAGCARVVDPGDGAALAEAIAALADAPGLRAELGERGRRHAERLLSRRSILAAFAVELAAMVPNGPASAARASPAGR